MVNLDIEELEHSIVDKLRTYFTISNDRGTSEATISPLNYSCLAQQFVPFSTVYRENKQSFPVDIMVKKVGEPDEDLLVKVYSNNSSGSFDVPNQALTGAVGTIPAENIPSTFGTYTRTWIDLTKYANHYLGSNTEYWLHISPKEIANLDESNYYVLQRDTIPSNFWFGDAVAYNDVSSTWEELNGNLRFKTSFPTWIYSDYPHVSLNLRAYPRIAVDVVSRPRVYTPWIGGDKLDYRVQVAVVIFARTAEEVSEILSYQDRILVKERHNLSNVVELLPVGISAITVPREGLYARSATYNARIIINKDQYP